MTEDSMVFVHCLVVSKTSDKVGQFHFVLGGGLKKNLISIDSFQALKLKSLNKTLSELHFLTSALLF